MTSELEPGQRVRVKRGWYATRTGRIVRKGAPWNPELYVVRLNVGRTRKHVYYYPEILEPIN